MKALAATCLLGAALVAACVRVPEPPSPPAGLVELQSAYDFPTARLSEPDVRRVLDGAPSFAITQSFGALRFVPRKVSDTSAALGDPGDLEVQGKVNVHVACPGEEPDAPADESRNGSLDGTIGVRNAKLLRSFSVVATRCRFQDEDGVAVLSGTLDVDLGADVLLGAAAPQRFLLRFSGVSGTVTSPSGVETALSLDRVSFRLTDGDTKETLVELDALGLALTGTAVVAAHGDGSVGLRVGNGEWVCGDESSPCALR